MKLSLQTTGRQGEKENSPRWDPWVLGRQWQGLESWIWVSLCRNWMSKIQLLTTVAFAVRQWCFSDTHSQSLKWESALRVSKDLSSYVSERPGPDLYQGRWNRRATHQWIISKAGTMAQATSWAVSKSTGNHSWLSSLSFLPSFLSSSFPPLYPSPPPPLPLLPSLSLPSSSSLPPLFPSFLSPSLFFSLFFLPPPNLNSEDSPRDSCVWTLDCQLVMLFGGVGSSETMASLAEVDY